MTYERIEELISITKEKNKLLKEIYNVTAKQIKVIDAENLDGLTEVLNLKDNLMNRIDKLDLSFISIFSQIKKDNSVEDFDELDFKQYPNLKDLKEAVKEITSTLMAISLIDEKNIHNMKSKLEQTRSDLRKLKEGKRAHRGYSATHSPSILIDKKK